MKTVIDYAENRLLNSVKPVENILKVQVSAMQVPTGIYKHQRRQRFLDFKTLLPLATKLWQGNVLHISVSHSAYRWGGGCLPHTPLGRPPGGGEGGVCHTHTPRQTPWSRYPSCPVHAGIHPPAQCMLGHTHPCPVYAGIWSTSRWYVRPGTYFSSLVRHVPYLFVFV